MSGSAVEAGEHRADARSLRALGATGRVHRRAVVATMVATVLLVCLTYWNLAQPMAGTDAAVREARAVAVSATYAPFLVITILAVFGPLLAMVLGAHLMTAPQRWRMLAQEVVQQGRRGVVVARLGLIWITAIGCLAVGMTVASAVAAVAFTAPADLRGPELGSFLSQALIVLLGMGLWGTAAAAVALWTRSAILAVVLPLVEAYTELTLAAGGVGPEAMRFLPATAQIATLSQVSFLPGGTTIVSAPLPMGGADLLGNVAVTLAFVGLLTATCACKVLRSELR